MTRLVSTNRLIDALKAEGYEIPKDCREARLVMGVDSAILIQFDCFVTDENLERIGRGFVRLAKDTA